MVDGLDQAVEVAIARFEMEDYAFRREILRADRGVERVVLVVADRDRPPVDDADERLVEIRPRVADAERDERIPASAPGEVPHGVGVERRKVEIDVGTRKSRDARRAVPDRELEAPGIGEGATIANAVRDVVVELWRPARALDAFDVVAEQLSGIEADLVGSGAVVLRGDGQRLLREHSERRDTDHLPLDL